MWGERLDYTRLRPIIHIILHFLVPAMVVRFFPQGLRLKTWLTLCATMLVDLDHLLADPIFDPNRCSINFHFLHSYPAIVVYGLGLVHPKTCVISLGLLIHMALDYIDCFFLE
jgi:hypothetical protein